MIQATVSDATSPSVTFVVVNWNQRQLTLDCLTSLREQDYPRFDVALVDNGSQDDSVPAVRARFPEVTVFENEANLGIAAANNAGIRYALHKGSDYIFLLNNDTAVAPDMLRHLVTAAQSEPDIGAAGPTMLYFDQPDTVWCAGNTIDWRTGGSKRCREGLRLDALAKLSQQQVDFITSCAVCIKQAVLRDVGLMDERYFIYYDETDWFARASAAGWRTVYVPAARMWHKVSAAMGTASPATDYYMNRNVLLFLAENLHGLAKVRSLGLAAGRNLLAAAAYTTKPHGGLRLPNRNARLYALRDAILGRWGKMGRDVEAVCYPD